PGVRQRHATAANRRVRTGAHHADRASTGTLPPPRGRTTARRGPWQHCCPVRATREFCRRWPHRVSQRARIGRIQAPLRGDTQWEGQLVRRLAIVVAIPLLAVGCSSSASNSGHAGATSTTRAAAAPTTSVAPTTLAITKSVPHASGPVDPNAKGKILMIKLDVGDLASGERFYR